MIRGVQLRFFIALAVWLLGWEALAAPVVTGNVKALTGAPLADVQVRVEIRSVKAAGQTDLNGRFQFDAATLFSSSELRDALGLTLMFSKPGFHPVNRVVRIENGQVPKEVAVQLDPIGGGGALDPAEKTTLDKHAAAPGSAALFLIPYSFTGVTGVDPGVVNERLRANLERVIVTHLQASAVGGSAAVALKLLPVSQTNDIDRMLAYGSYLKALGMITGYGAAESPTGGARTLGVSSTFLVVSKHNGAGAPILYVDDDLPTESLTSSRLYKNLSKLWGRSTVLALGVSEFDRAKTAHDKEALKRIRTYLQAERAGAGPGDEALVSQLNTLVAAVDQELAR